MNKTFERKCPSCRKSIFHTIKKNRNRFQKQGRLCHICASVERSNRPEFKKKMSEYGKTLVGEKNPFYGKHHSEETKEKIRQKNKENVEIFRTKKFRKKMSNVTKGDKNPMFGRTFYDVWIEKYGREIADEKLKEYKLKKSNMSSGEKNPMYGKPAPKCSGGGWSGWYNKFYFRSLKELAYILKLEDEKIPFVSGEKACYSIKYIDDCGNERTYRADFFVDGFKLIEIKPIKLQNKLNNQQKEKTATKYCKEKGWVYEIVDIEPVTMEKLEELISLNKLKLTYKWKRKLCLMKKKK